jgi:hypothetical protein
MLFALNASSDFERTLEQFDYDTNLHVYSWIFPLCSFRHMIDNYRSYPISTESRFGYRKVFPAH